MRKRVHRRFLSLALSAALLAAALPALAAAASREPLSLYHAELADPAAGLRSDSLASPGPGPALAEGSASAAEVAAPTVASNVYGPETVASVLADLEALPHGPEMAELSVLVETPEEVAATCGETVLACYFPAEMKMVVSGTAASGGVERGFAIAHEYAHHVAAAQRADAIAPIDGGTIRWATYERVCQFTRAGRLYPGDQGGRYWRNPEEAFAESYAQLVDPAEAGPWDFTPLLAPSPASLAKLRADLEHPWSGPVSRSVSGSLSAPPARRGPERGAGGGREALAGARALERPWVADRVVRTPLDGTVSVTLTAPPSAALAFSLRDPRSGRVLAGGLAAAGASGEISYPNCGHDELTLEVRSVDGAGSFQAIVRRP